MCKDIKCRASLKNKIQKIKNIFLLKHNLGFQNLNSIENYKE